MFNSDTEPKIIRVPNYEGPALPKSVLADAYGYTPKELYTRIKNDIGEGFNHSFKKFSPMEVQEIMKALGFNLDWSVIDRYRNTLK